MPTGKRLLVVLLCLVFGGCATTEPKGGRAITFLDRPRPGKDPNQADIIQLDVALLERPIYDAYLDKELWAVVDERLDSLLIRGIVQANGFRVGVMGGITPPELVKMMTSERSCINPRSKTLHSGGSTTIAIGPTVASCRFQLQLDDGPKLSRLDKANIELVITPTLTKDGKTKLTFTPQSQHGEESVVYRPVPGGWLQRPQRQVDTYTNLTWEITIAPGQMALVGGCTDKPDSLGHVGFIRADETPPIRRLLVICPHRSTSGVANDALKPTETSGGKRRPVSLIEHAAASE